MAKKPNRLGRGLNSLISSSLIEELPSPEKTNSQSSPSSTQPKRISIDEDTQSQKPTSIVGRLAQLDAVRAEHESTSGEPRILNIPVESIVPNRNQPRRLFNPVSISGLARSISESGILQPLLVRLRSEPGEAATEEQYELIAGERRLRAAKAAGIETVPVIVKSIDSQTSMEIALVENIQREDLNAIDRARAYRVYCDRTGYSADEASRRLGEDRSTVANYLRLLDLSQPVAKLLESGQLSMGHARALLGAKDPECQIDYAKRAITQGLSVRAVEALVKSVKVSTPNTTMAEGPIPDALRPSQHLADIEGKLQHTVKTKVTIKTGRGAHRGKIIIDYYSLDDFDRIAAMLGYTDSDAQ